MNDKIEKFFRILNETKEPAYDVETNGLDWKRCHVVGYSVSDGRDSVYIPTRHSGGNNIDCVSDFECKLCSAINVHTGKIIGHNIKFDEHFSQNHDIKIGNKIVDTLVTEALLNENRRSYALEAVCKNYDITPKLGKELYNHISQVTGCKNDRSSMGLFHKLSGDDPIAVEYAERDTLCTKQLYDQQYKSIYGQNLDVVADLENKLSYALQKMERRGVLVDLEELAKVKREVDEMYETALLKIGTVDDEDGLPTIINIRSGKDLKEYFQSCEIDDWPMTAPTQRFPEGQPSFNKEFLATSQPGLDILNARRLGHLKASFLDVIDSHIYKSRIHTTFNQTIGETHGTRSGRLSSSYPNMQQVPKRDKELGKIYRRIFIPARDFIFVEYDYSQAEPRLFTYYSNEPSLIRGYASTPFVDMHSVVTEHMGEFAKRVAAVSNSAPRDIVKNLNLGIMYTMGYEKLARKLGITVDEAKKILYWHYRAFPKCREFTQKAARVAEVRGYVKTLLGRRSRFDNVDYSYRAANRIVQGGSADILKWKLVEVDAYLESFKLEDVCRMVLNIHDAILFEIHKDHLRLIPIIKDILENVSIPPLNVTIPFVAEYKTGANWSEATYGA